MHAQHLHYADASSHHIAQITVRNACPCWHACAHCWQAERVVVCACLSLWTDSLRGEVCAARLTQQAHVLLSGRPWLQVLHSITTLFKPTAMAH
jgi:hypothetical protein